jgi:hypothetical protein
MADVYAVFGTLLALGIAFPGMLTAWWLLFPDFLHRAEWRLTRSRRRCLGTGIAIIIPISILAVVLVSLPLGVFKFLGGSIIVLTLGFASLGTAAIALSMGKRVGADTEQEQLTPKHFLLAAVALELAAVFPIVGWFIMIPTTILISLGASFYATFKRGQVAEKVIHTQEPALSHGS